MNQYEINQMYMVPYASAVGSLMSAQHAVASASGDKYYGAKTTINLWQPTIEGGNGFSLAQLWITGGMAGDTHEGENINTPSSKIRSSVDSPFMQKKSCPGFIQTNNQIAISGSISPVSIYGGSQHDIDISIWKDPKGGNWWLQVGSDVLGYWPSSMFCYLSDKEGFGKASYIKNIQVVDSSNNLKLPNGAVLLAE
uniref:Neprosin PEP catalytic domain-containing protein n=1 Tax=Setaria viridis TaxID=4556 RepID=A0A4V6D378_SETVI|nr:hypothetical protein SEVIR_8G187500v2 [Setaria viridis]